MNMATITAKDKENDGNLSKSFSWLRRDARGPTYVSYAEFSNRAACSFEFGADGFAASCNHGGEILHMSAISRERGIVFARGDIEDSLYSTIARGQRQSGGKSAFGLKVAQDRMPFDATREKNGSSFKLGPMIETGCFNYRWPFHEYVLALNGDIPKDVSDKSVLKEMGTCATLSFIKDGVLYQVLQLEQGCRVEAETCYPFPTDGQIALTVGGPIKFQAWGSGFEYGKSLNPDGGCHLCASTSGTKTATCLEAKVYKVLPNDEYEPLILEPSPDGVDDQHDYERARVYSVFAKVTGRMSRQRSETFLAAFRLRGDSDNRPWPKVPNSEEIYDYIGIQSSSCRATAAMWDNIFLLREEKTNSFSELSEVKLIGRCLEKVLQVDLVPTAFAEGDKMVYRENAPLALISNLFVNADIDLKALFWKVRFIIKVYRYLSYVVDQHLRPHDEQSKIDKTPVLVNDTKEKHRIYGSDLSDDEIEATECIAKFQMARILSYVKRIMAYHVEALIKPKTITPLLPDDSKSVEPNYYYVMVTLWYVVRKWPESTWGWANEIETWPNDRGLLADPTHLPSDNGSYKSETQHRVSLLKWYHYASVWELCKMRLIPNVWLDDDHERKVLLFKRNAKRDTAAMLSSHNPYLPDDEIIDRLSFLAEALGLEASNYSAGTIASSTVRRIQERDFTRELNPGSSSNDEEEQTSGPWEIHALCHHSSLLVANYQYKNKDDRTRMEKAQEVEIFRRKFSNFVTAEGCIVPCWERTNITARRGWLRSEATSVLASTLLSICEKDLELAGEEADTDPDAHHSMSPVKLALSTLSAIGFEGHYLRGAKKVHEVSKRHNKNSSADLLLNSHLGDSQQGENVSPPIEWVKYCPPRRYHPESFFNSLDDTPELYRPPFINRVKISPLLRSRIMDYYEKLGKQQVCIKKDDVKKALKQQLVSIIDIKASEPKRSDCRGGQYEISRAGPVAKADESSHPSTVDGRKILNQRLTDSLVDQHVQHRILSIGNFSDDLLSLFVYVFHPESANSLDNHILRLSGFTCQKRGTWISQITLKSWSLSEDLKDSESDKSNMPRTFKEEPQQIDENFEYSPIRLPDVLEQALKTLNPGTNPSKPKKPGIIEPNISSIILSTNTFGDFSKCTISSNLISHNELRSLGEEAKELWQRFIHQPQTGRCLVFLIALGVVCQKIERDYKGVVEDLVETVKLNDNFMQYDLNNRRHDHKQSLAHFRLAMWSLESLYKLKKTLATSINTITHAKTELITQINDGPGKRSDRLEAMCQETVETFERNLGLLTASMANLERKIELNDRYMNYKDTLSTALSLHQNDSIQKLTYVTIGYLPIGLSAAIFAIPNDQHVLFDNMGRPWFIGCILIMFVVTFAVSAYLEYILGFFRRSWAVSFPTRPPGSSGGSSDISTPERPSFLDRGNDSGRPPAGSRFKDSQSSSKISSTGLLHSTEKTDPSEMV